MHRQLDATDRRRGSTVGGWWKFDAYSIEGAHIRPAPHARLHRYDPWQEFLQSRAETAGQPPYRDLLSLMEQVELIPGRQRFPDCLTPASQSLIRAWCARHGLLGVLLSRWEMVRLAPHRTAGGERAQVHYGRAFGDSVYRMETSGDRLEKTGRALIHALDDLNVQEEPLEQTWARFFPTVPHGQKGSYPYPPPYTDEFCRLYAEPLLEFYQAAKLLTQTIYHLSGTTKATDELARAPQQAEDMINLFRRPVTAVVHWQNDGLLGSRYEAPSLLASFAEMFVQDHWLGRLTLQCDCCGGSFVSAAYQALYCSSLCRQTQQKRNVREKMRQARTYRREGLGVRQIASALRVDTQLIRHWLAQSKKATQRGKPRPV